MLGDRGAVVQTGLDTSMPACREAARPHHRYTQSEMRR